MMLADACESATRAMGDPSAAQIEGLVRDLAMKRLLDKQFDECDLTLRDINIAQEAFVQQLLGMYHQRVAYPQSKVVEIESRRAAGENSTSVLM